MKKIYFLIIMLVTQLTFSQESARQKTIPSFNEAVYTTAQVTTKPQFKGGSKALKNFIKKNFKNPSVSGLKGEVLVSFIIEKNGSLTEIGVLNDVGHGTGDEAIRIMGVSPVWIPGKLNGNPVRTQYLVTIPVITN
jgi:hypothetical protein